MGLHWILAHLFSASGTPNSLSPLQITRILVTYSLVVIASHYMDAKSYVVVSLRRRRQCLRLCPMRWYRISLGHGVYASLRRCSRVCHPYGARWIHNKAQRGKNRCSDGDARPPHRCVPYMRSCISPLLQLAKMVRFTFSRGRLARYRHLTASLLSFSCAGISVDVWRVFDQIHTRKVGRS